MRVNQKQSLLKEDEELNMLIIDAIQDIKGKNIVKIDLRKLNDAPTQFFIICEGDSTTQVRAISDNISRRLRDELGVKPDHVEGQLSNRWILVDYFNTIVHVFHPESREHYALEDLWSDGQHIAFENIA